jgi:hypothetical protein
MYEMRAEVDLAAGTPPVWHVLRKDLAATLCGRLTSGGGPWCQVSGESELYCRPCLATFSLEAGHPS